jgi:hypothetical protein
MRTVIEKSCITFLLIAVVVGLNSAFAAPQPEKDEQGILVGRIAHIEGQLLRYMPDEDDWVLTDVDTPFGEYDNLFSSEDGKAELIMPNNTLLRIGGDTQVQLIELTEANTQLVISSGTARLYNRSSAAEIKATTSFGNVILPPATVCDVYVHEKQAEVASLKGTVVFTQHDRSTRHDVIAGSSSIIATPDNIVASAYSTTTAWDRWNADRDAQWTKRMQARGQSAQYLPDSLQQHAWELENNGRWERVYYDGAHRYFWRPVYVNAGWTPFSAGRWILWRGEHTWVPGEPFGYVTHHYGNWVYAGSCWYWAPPVSRVMVSAGLPLLHVGMNWYPGRVAWVSSGFSIGWIPLAPYEIYYSSRYWGSRSRVRHYHHYYDCRKYRHYRHARFVEHRHFYRSKNYRHAGIRSMKPDEKVRAASRVPENVRRNFKPDNRNRFASNMPQFRDKIRRIEVRENRPNRQMTRNRPYANPFNREAVRDVINNRRPGVTDMKKTAATVVRDRRSIQRRPETAGTVPKTRMENRERAKTVRTDTARVTERLPTARRPLLQQNEKKEARRLKDRTHIQRPVERTFNRKSENRGTLRAPVPAPRETARRSLDAAGQGGLSRNFAPRGTVSGRRPVSNPSGQSLSAGRPDRGAIGIAPRTGNQRFQSGGAGRMQGSSGRNRR